MPTWLLWIGGGALGLGGIALLAWSLFADRLRGGRLLRRCPRCWYDMNGVPGLTCPECGRAAREERRLHRSRRRWRWAALALVVMALGVGLGATPAVQARGWQSLLPTTAVIYILPWVEPREKWYSDLLYDRTGKQTIPRWQRRLLFSRCDAVLQRTAPFGTKFETLRIIERISWRGGYQGRPTGEAGEALPVLVRAMGDANPRIRGFAAGLASTVDGDPGLTVAALATMAASDADGEARRSAIRGLFHLSEHAAPAAPSIIAATRFEGTPYLQRDALSLLGHLGPATARLTLPTLMAALAAEENELRLAAAQSLGKLGPAAADAAPALAQSLRSDPDFVVRREAATALEAIGVRDDATTNALLGALADEEGQVSGSAFVALHALRGGEAAIAERLEAWLDAKDPLEASAAVVLLSKRGHEVAPYARWLVPRLTVAEWHWSERMNAAKMLCECGYTGRDALEPATAMLESENDRIRVWAEVLIAQINGDRRRAVPALIGIVERNASVNASNARGDAAEALALIGPGAEAALPLLEAMLAERAWAPRENAKRAIHAITGEPLEGRLAPTPVGAQ